MPALNRTAFLALGVAVILLSGCDLGTVVEVVQVANLELEPESQPVQLGNTFQLDARATSDRGEPLSPTLLAFSSSNTSIATVSPTGVVTTTGPGTVIITAAADGLSATSTVHSIPLPCPVTGTLRPGESGSGQVDPGPCTFNGFHIDVWFLEIRSETSVQIDMSSDDFTASLILLEWDGNDSARNVASANLRLTLTLSPGVYEILAMTDFAGETGAYRLSVS